MNTPAMDSAILVADDSSTDVFFLERRLQTAGIQNPLVHVQDGIEAVRWLERAFRQLRGGGPSPWLVFVDLKMPRMDGFELLASLRQRGWLEHLTVSVLSTSDEPEDMARAQKLGAHRFLIKYPPVAHIAEVVALARSRPAGIAAWNGAQQPK